MKLDKHLYIDEDRNDKVLNCAKIYNIGYSDMIIKMIDSYFANNKQSDKITNIQNELNSIHKLNNLTYNLLEQLYSDLNLTNITNPYKSYAVKEFKKRMIDKRLDG